MNQSSYPAETPPPAAPVQRRFPLPLHTPFWTYALLAAIGLMFLLETTLPMFIDQILPYLPADYAGLQPANFSGGSTNNYVLILLGANFRPLILQGQVWRFFTSMFLHIGLTHLFFNAYALFIFGVEMERVFGKARFLTIYILSGLLASFASFALGSAVLSAGASGAIFGVVGMEAAYFFKHKDILGKAGKNRLINVGVIVAINLMFGFSQPGIDNMAHIGGLISGALLAYVMLPNYKITQTAFNQPRVIDQSSVQTWIWAPVVAAAVLLVGSYVTIWLS